MTERQINLRLRQARKAHRLGVPNPEAAILDPDELGNLREAALAAKYSRAENREYKAAREQAEYEAKKAAGELFHLKPQPESSRQGAGGPRTPEGKAISALNNLQHGLTGSFRIIGHERQEEFDSVVVALKHEHQPATTTEHTLLEKMAEHLWLSRRAQRLQDFALEEDDLPRLNVYLRYQTTNERAFYKAFHEFTRLKKEREKAEQAPHREFVSQKRRAQEEEWQLTRVRLANARSASLEVDTEIRRHSELAVAAHQKLTSEGQTLETQPKFVDLNGN